MSDVLKCVYQILKELEASLDIEHPELKGMSAQALGITEQKRNRILSMMLKDELISGVTITSYYSGFVDVDTSNITITLKGVEYLHENSAMVKIAKAAKGIAEIVL